MDNKVKVEIVVLDGDFPEEDRSSTAWTSEEFGRNVVKERTGKRPLLAGDCLTFTLRDGCASLGEIEFTDNSSWIRSRKFRIGARVVRDGGRGLRVREAMTEAFIVKDHRGELYKKHHPPMLEDEVWRLEKIGKDGAFHKKLAAEGVNSVQDFLKLSVVDPLKLRKMLGAGMSDKMWEVTIKHARRCELGNKHYIYRGPSYCLTLNPICQVVNATISGQDCSNLDISGINKLYIENLVRQAYTNWHDLQEVIGIPSDVASLNQGEVMDQYPNHHDHQEQQQQQPQQEQHHIVAKPIPLSFHHQYNLGMGGYMELGGIIQQPSHQQQINTIEQQQGNMSNNTSNNNNNSWHINSSSSYHPHNQQLVSNVASLEPVDEGLRHTASNPSLTDGEIANF
ncbi:unnamed protein product [Linum tenue]|uniref:Uncharacterized protein n=1 Tax=Linum tenue TaxID=586396 RepID=A0AAV0QS68_9ROSI|nr:unnamed protein product [Linum tenue]